MNFKRLFLALVVLIGAVSAEAVIVPSSRLLSWDAGFPGGLFPYYTNSITITSAPYSADSNGVLDCSSILTNAIANCSNFSAIYFPPGVYVISNQIQIKDKAIVIRGAGSNLTHIIGRHTNATGQGLFYVRGASSSLYLMTNGQVFGSTAVMVTNTSSLSAGTYVAIMQINDTNTLEGNIPGGETTTSAYYQKQWNRITSVSGMTLNLARPLYSTYDPTTNLYPRVQRMVPTTNCGFENFRFTQQGTNDGNFYFFQAADCWISGIWSSNVNWYHIAYENSFRCSAISNTFQHGNTYGQGGYGASVSGSTDIKIENNVLYHLRHSIIVQNGNTGSDIFANYSSSMYATLVDTNTNYLMPDYEFHGGQPRMNIIRHNVGQKGTSEDFWGSSAHNTFERNYFHGENYDMGTNINSALYAFTMNALQLSNNIVGNVFAYPGYRGVATNEIGLSYNGNPYDTRVTNTWIFHGNVDAKNNTTWWDAGIVDTAIPTSYASTNKPSYWGSVPWPAIGPDLVTKTNMIPAQSWWNGIAYPYTGTPAEIVTNITTTIAVGGYWDPILSRIGAKVFE